MNRILFTEKDLINLLKGKVVKFDGVEIALEDIVYDKIFKVLVDNLK